MKSRSHSYDINRPSPKHGHKYTHSHNKKWKIVWKLGPYLAEF